MIERSDENLLDLYFAGDAEAFEEFFRRHSGRVIGYAISKGLPTEIALEVRQEAFLKLHRAIHSYERGRPALPWFFTIVHSAVMDVLRLSRRVANLKSLAMAENNTNENAHRPIESRDSEKVLNILPDDQRQIVELRVLGGLSFLEISAKVGMSDVALRKTFERARKRLQDLMSEED